jgi:hypothetical protein
LIGTVRLEFVARAEGDPPIGEPQTADQSTSGTGGTKATVTVKPADVLFPVASVAVQVTGVAPTAKTEPDAGAHATLGFGSAESPAVGSV